MLLHIALWGPDLPFILLYTEKIRKLYFSVWLGQILLLYNLWGNSTEKWLYTETFKCAEEQYFKKIHLIKDVNPSWWCASVTSFYCIIFVIPFEWFFFQAFKTKYMDTGTSTFNWRSAEWPISQWNKGTLAMLCIFSMKANIFFH